MLMTHKKIYLFLFLALVLILSGCSSSNPTKSAAQHSTKSKSADQGITALAAWQKVKSQVDQWDSQAKLISIKDKSYASFQRQNGLADVWQFVTDQCLAKNERHNYCNKGKSRTYIYGTTKGGWGPQGVSANAEEFSSYGVPIDVTKLKIDTDRAVELAREKMGQQANEYDDFIIDSFTTEQGVTYWHIVRQCWSKRVERQACNSSDGYDVYVNAETGEVLISKPRDN